MAPATPVDPVAPVVPESPVAPATPVVPVAPVAPVAPAAPGGQSRPGCTRRGRRQHGSAEVTVDVNGDVGAGTVDVELKFLTGRAAHRAQRHDGVGVVVVDRAWTCACCAVVEQRGGGVGLGLTVAPHRDVAGAGGVGDEYARCNGRSRGRDRAVGGGSDLADKRGGDGVIGDGRAGRAFAQSAITGAGVNDATWRDWHVDQILSAVAKDFLGVFDR